MRRKTKVWTGWAGWKWGMNEVGCYCINNTDNNVTNNKNVFLK